MKTAWVGREELPNAINPYLKKVDVVLDIGPGIRPQTFIEAYLHICVEPHLPYIEHLRRELGDDPRYVFLNSAWDVALKLLPAKSVDTVFCVDMIEHMEKATGFELLKEAGRVARQQVVIFTPLGFFPQPYDDPEKPDRWGMDGGYWQAHRSGWIPEDFGEGWDFVCCDSFHLVDHDEQTLEKPIGAFWAVQNLTATRMQPKRRGARNQKYRGKMKGWLKYGLSQVLPSSAYGSLHSAWQNVKRGLR